MLSIIGLCPHATCAFVLLVLVPAVNSDQFQILRSYIHTHTQAAHFYTLDAICISLALNGKFCATVHQMQHCTQNTNVWFLPETATVVPFTQTDTHEHAQTSGAFQTLFSNEPRVNGLGWLMVGFEYPKAQSWIKNHMQQQLHCNTIARTITCDCDWF